MERYYESEALIEFVKRHTPHIDGETTLECVERAIREAPTVDIAPKSEVAREIIAKFKTATHSEIVRNELLADYGDDFYEGRIDAFLTAIDLLAEIAMEYSEDKNDT